MNRDIFDWARAQITSGPEFKATLMMLASQAEADGRGQIAFADLLLQTELTERGLRAALGSLEVGGFIYVNVSDAGVVSYRLCLHKKGPRR